MWSLHLLGLYLHTQFLVLISYVRAMTHLLLTVVYLYNQKERGRERERREENQTKKLSCPTAYHRNPLASCWQSKFWPTKYRCCESHLEWPSILARSVLERSFTCERDTTHTQLISFVVFLFFNVTHSLIIVTDSFFKVTRLFLNLTRLFWNLTHLFWNVTVFHLKIKNFSGNFQRFSFVFVLLLVEFIRYNFLLRTNSCFIIIIIINK